jgi:hypothetical protein
MNKNDKVCNYCNKFAYTNYRDKRWNSHMLCVVHVKFIREGEFLDTNLVILDLNSKEKA